MWRVVSWIVATSQSIIFSSVLFLVDKLNNERMNKMYNKWYDYYQADREDLVASYQVERQELIAHYPED